MIEQGCCFGTWTATCDRPIGVAPGPLPYNRYCAVTAEISNAPTIAAAVAVLPSLGWQCRKLRGGTYTFCSKHHLA